MQITSSNIINIEYVDSNNYDPSTISLYLVKGGVKYKAEHLNSVVTSVTTHTFTCPISEEGVYKIEVVRAFTQDNGGRTELVAVDSFKKVRYSSALNLLTTSFGYIGTNYTMVTLPLSPDIFEDDDALSLDLFKGYLTWSTSGNFSVIKELDISSTLNDKGVGKLVILFNTPFDTTYTFTILKESNGKVTKVGHGSAIRPSTTNTIYILENKYGM